MMEILVIILIYIVGIFAAIALSTYLFVDESDDNKEYVVFFSICSWVFIAAILLIFITGIMWFYVIQYPFVWFYNKCKERFKNKKK